MIHYTISHRCLWKKESKKTTRMFCGSSVLSCDITAADQSSAAPEIFQVRDQNLSGCLCPLVPVCNLCVSVSDNVKREVKRAGYRQDSARLEPRREKPVQQASPKPLSLI